MASTCGQVETEVRFGVRIVIKGDGDFILPLERYFELLLP